MDEKRTFAVVIIVIALFTGFMLGYSIPPFIHAGVFSDREEKGVAVEMNEQTEEYYKNLLKEEKVDE